MPLRRVRVFAAAGPDAPPDWSAAAAAVDLLLADNGMTKVADDAGELADGFLALPGGVDSLQRLFVLLTSGRARDAEPPCGLLNVDDYYTGLLKTADDLTVERFIRETQRGMLIVDRDPDALLRAMADFRPPETRRLFPRDDDQAF